MSKQSEKDALVGRVGLLMQRMQEVTEMVDEAAAVAAGLNRTDARLWSALMRAEGGLTAGALGAEVGLSKGATTTAIDRLERAGYVERSPSPTDRRSVIVSLTAAARARAEALWGPLAVEGARVMAGFTADELRVVERALEASIALQQDHVARLAGGDAE